MAMTLRFERKGAGSIPAGNAARKGTKSVVGAEMPCGTVLIRWRGRIHYLWGEINEKQG